MKSPQEAPVGSNEYRPWESEGITEVEYWKRAYLDARRTPEPYPEGGGDLGVIAENVENARHRAWATAAVEESAPREEAPRWQACPVCMGRGDHEMGFYGGGLSSSVAREKCRTCDGRMIARTPTEEKP